MDWLRAKLEMTQVSRIISGIRYIFQNILIILRPKRDSIFKKIISGAYRIHAEDFSQSSETQSSLLEGISFDKLMLFIRKQYIGTLHNSFLLICVCICVLWQI